MGDREIGGLRAEISALDVGADSRTRGCKSVKAREVLRHALRTAGLEVRRVERNSASQKRRTDQSLLSTDQKRVLSRYQAYMASRHLHGCIVEAGVGEGWGLAYWSLLQSFSNDKRSIYACDSFAGFPSGTSHDSEHFLHHGKPHYATFSMPYVRAYLADLGVREE